MYVPKDGFTSKGFCGSYFHEPMQHLEQRQRLCALPVETGRRQWGEDVKEIVGRNILVGGSVSVYKGTGKK